MRKNTLTHVLQDKLVLSDGQRRLNADHQLGGLDDGAGLDLHLADKREGLVMEVEGWLREGCGRGAGEGKLTCTVTDGTGSPSMSRIRASCGRGERKQRLRSVKRPI